MMYSIRPKIPWLARGSGRPLAWDVRERETAEANVTESSGGAVGTKTLLHARDTLSDWDVTITGGIGAMSVAS